jgi:dTDP-4-amino-4,6-dideoxygalactose transaminase
MNMKLRNIPFSPPDMTEAEAKEVREAILSGWITTGPRTKKLEQQISEYVHTDKTVCLNSATAALEMVLHLLDIQPDDEVIVPAYTYTATASVTQHVGCKLVLVDSQKDNVEMDYDKLAAAITEKTKVIAPVDLGGIVADYDRVFEIVEKKKALFRPNNALQAKIGRIVVSADCAHSFGASRNVNNNLNNGEKVNKMAGEIADFSSFSFHAVKNFTTAEGGALTWNLPFGNENVNLNLNLNLNNNLDYFPTVPKKEGETWNELLYRISQLFSLHGQNKDALAKTKLGAWEYDIIGPWYKCNMTDIMAALGLVQMERYAGILKRRYEIVERYNAAIDNLNVNLGVNLNDNFNLNKGVVYLNHKDTNHCSSHHLYLVRLLGKTREETNKVIEQMAERGIATNVHYKPLPMMTAYKALGFDIKNYPNAYHLFENEVTLPLHTCLTDEDVEYVISNFVDIVSKL